MKNIFNKNFVFISLIILLIAIFYFFVSQHSKYISDDDKIEIIINNIKTYYNDFKTDVYKDLEMIQHYYDISENINEKTKENIRKYVFYNNDKYNYFFIKKDSDYFVTKNIDYDILKNLGQNVKNQNSDTFYRSEILKSNDNHLFFVYKIIYNKDKIINCGFTINDNFFSDFLNKHKVDGVEQVIIADKSGTILYHNDRTLNKRKYNILKYIENSKIKEYLEKESGKIDFNRDNYLVFKELDNILNLRVCLIFKKDLYRSGLTHFYFIIFSIIVVFLLLFIVYHNILKNRYLYEIKKVQYKISEFLEKKGINGKFFSDSLLSDEGENKEKGIISLITTFITEKEKKIEELKGQINILYNFIDNISIMCVKISNDGTIIYANKNFINYLNNTNDATGLKIWEVEKIKSISKIKEKIINDMKKASLNEIVKNNIIISNNDDYSALEYSILKAKTESGKDIFFIVEFEDITKKLMFENEITNLRKLEAIGLLAGGIAHDFNNILTGILGSLTLIKIENNPEKSLLEKIDKIENNIMKAKDITQQLLTFAKGGSPLFKPLIINEVIENSAKSIFSDSNMEYHISSDNEYKIDGDESQLTQVFSNIFINSLQATQNSGKVSIVIRKYEKNEYLSSILPQNRKYVKISIVDNGPGIPENIRHKIFDPYFTTKKNCSGLGLAISYSIIKKHNGLIYLDSDENGNGTIISILLPILEKVEKIDSYNENIILLEKNRNRGNKTMNKRIIILDDDQLIANVTEKILKHNNYEVVVTYDGIDTIQMIKDYKNNNKPFDIAILDLTIPGGAGGREINAKIKEIDPQIKTIVSSGYSNDEVLSSYKEFGFDAILPKPYNYEDLLNIIKNL